MNNSKTEIKPKSEDNTDAWFRRRGGVLTRDLGWGYTPIKKEGWISIGIYIIVIMFLSFVVLDESNPSTTPLFTGGIVASIVILIIICDYKCDKPYIFKKKISDQENSNEIQAKSKINK